MRPVCLALLLGVFLGCAHTDATTEASAETSSMPSPIDVCVQVEGADARPVRAVPMRAGVYDPNTPIDPVQLNWTVEGLGCIAYPSADAPVVPCGSAPRRRVAQVRCRQ